MLIPLCRDVPHLYDCRLEPPHRGSCLIKRLNDLHTIDIFYNGRVHIDIGHHVFLHHFTTAKHHAIIDHVSQNGRNQSGQRHAPVDHQQIQDDKNRDKYAGGHLGDSVSQRSFQPFRIIYDKLLELAGRFALNCSHRYLGHLFHNRSTNIFDDFVSYLVGAKRRFCVKGMLQKIPAHSDGR